MNDIGIVRELDPLGRVVLPIELRKKFEINSGDAMEVFVDGEKVLIKKYNPACIFCYGFDDLNFFKGKKVCKACSEEIRNFKI